MRILLVGKTGVFDTLAVACGCLNIMDISNSSYFGDLGLENSKILVKVSTDHGDMELFVVGYKAPEIINTINQELGSLTKINNQDRFQVIPLSIEGETITWVLTKLANAPLIGNQFLKWAKQRTLNRSPYLIELGKNLRVEKNIDCMVKTDLVIAAKPSIK
jgi:hypothetical protein